MQNTKEKAYFYPLTTILSTVCWSAAPLDHFGRTSDNAEVVVWRIFQNCCNYIFIR